MVFFPTMDREAKAMTQATKTADPKYEKGPGWTGAFLVLDCRQGRSSAGVYRSGVFRAAAWASMMVGSLRASSSASV